MNLKSCAAGKCGVFNQVLYCRQVWGVQELKCCTVSKFGVRPKLTCCTTVVKFGVSMELKRCVGRHTWGAHGAFNVNKVGLSTALECFTIRRMGF